MKKIIKTAVIILWMSFIFYMSHQPATVSAEQSGEVRNVLLNMPMIGNIVAPILKSSIGEFLIRKSAHMFLYFVLTVLVFSLVHRSIFNKDINKLTRSLVISLVVVFLYACTDEIHQLFIPGRSGELRDVMVDTFGGIIGVGLILVINKIKINKKEYKENI